MNFKVWEKCKSCSSGETHAGAPPTAFTAQGSLYWRRACGPVEAEHLAASGGNYDSQSLYRVSPY